MLEKCLLSIQNQHIEIETFEVIISDDGENAKKLQTQFPNFVFVKGPQKGPAANRNNGVKFAKGEWLVFIDDDVIADPHLLQNFYHSVKNSEDSSAFEGAILPERPYNPATEDCPVNEAGGRFWSANIVIQRKLFTRIDGFDERYPFAALEDQDIYFRLLQETKIPFIKSAFVTHPIREKYFLRQIKFATKIYPIWLYHARKHRVRLIFKFDRDILISHIRFYTLNSFKYLFRFDLKNSVLMFFNLVWGGFYLLFSINQNQD